MKTVRLAAVAVLGALWSGWVQAEPLTLLETGSVLRFVDTATPSVSLGTVTVTGLQPGEAITAIDYRPANGALYGVGVVDGGLSRLYTIDTATGVASLIGGGPFDPRIGLSPTGGLGMDFDPVADLIRLVNNVGTNMRVHPDTATASVDTETNFAADDTNQSNQNSPNSIAYSNNLPDAGATTLYGVVSGNGPQVVRIGSPGGTPVSPDSGQMFTVGATGTAGFSQLHQGLDISRSGIAYMIVDNDNRLYTVNLATGVATALGSLPPVPRKAPWIWPPEERIRGVEASISDAWRQSSSRGTGEERRDRWTLAAFERASLVSRRRSHQPGGTGGVRPSFFGFHRGLLTRGVEIASGNHWIHGSSKRKAKQKFEPKRRSKA